MTKKLLLPDGLTEEEQKKAVDAFNSNKLPSISEELKVSIPSNLSQEEKNKLKKTLLQKSHIERDVITPLSVTETETETTEEVM